jgi:ATP-dependent Lhr-like helicase
VVARDLTEPRRSRLEILTARPYAFLDDAPARGAPHAGGEQRRWLDPKTPPISAGSIRPPSRACAAEAWPEAATPDELHDGLVLLGFLREEETVHEPAWPALFARLAEARRATRATGADGAMRWVAAERLAELLALHPGTQLVPPIAPVIEDGQQVPTAEQARLSLLRSRLEGSGPITAAALTRDMGLGEPGLHAALAELEQQGFALQGRFTPGVLETEWCERRLLARIHRYTLKQLRSEIEAVAPADFMRFLFHWQRLDDPGEGIEGLAAALTQLEGCAAPASAWEAHILPSRVKGYTPDELDRLCASGRFAWFRPLAARQGAKEGRPGAPTLRAAPIALVPRSNLPFWRRAEPVDGAAIELSAYARAVAEVFARHPAAFFEDLLQHSGLLHTQLEAALAELAAAGLVNCDSFAGLRALLAPQHLRPGYNSGRRRRRAHAPGVEHAGRWVWLPPVQPLPGNNQETATCEHIARALLRRYGVVFRRLVARQAGAPAWRELIQVYRRLEARGEIRGGRFVDGFSGEQYGLPEAVGALREVRRQGRNGLMISLSGADPLNMTGIITPGDRVPAQTANRVLYRDGMVIAGATGGKAVYTEQFTEGLEAQAPRSREPRVL